MYILLRGVFVLVFTSLLSISCSSADSSVSLALPADIMQEPVYAASQEASGKHIRSVPLKALNENARAGTINAPEKSDAMYFAFEKSPEILSLLDSGLYALELEFEPLTGKTVRKEANLIQIDNTGFIVGLLYADDFTTAGKLKENIRPRHPVTAQRFPHRAFTVSIGFAGIAVPPADIRGFMVAAQESFKLKSAAVVPVRYGWLKDKTALWYGTTADGGVVPSELCAESRLPLSTAFPKPSALIESRHTERGGRDNIIIHFDEALPIALTAEQTQQRLSFQCSGKHISVYRAPNVYRFTLDGCLFPDSLLTIEQADAESLTDTDIPPETGEQTDTSTTVCGITIEYSIPALPDPITADPGLILHWPQEQWRHLSYELFAWEQFPSVLIFDFADYAVQDAHLKRLSFFAEKKGFTGKLLFDEALVSLHGFNAHDYRAETLAAFFRKAEAEHFPLNKSELHLRSILFRNGIIIRTEQGIEAGHGAIVSISRESSANLRYRFITHECLHGIYFTEESFRNTVERAFQQTDPRAVLFLRRYFEVYPTLQYEIDDDYLLQNEFMAYLLQQDRGFLQEYYSRVSWFRTMTEAEPALCRYIRRTNAEAFMQAAAQMSSFLYTAWGLKAGRICLSMIENL